MPIHLLIMNGNSITLAQLPYVCWGHSSYGQRPFWWAQGDDRFNRWIQGKVGCESSHLIKNDPEMCCNNAKWWVNMLSPSWSPCTIHISLSALIIHVQTLWENRVGGVVGEGVVAHSSLHHMNPLFHGWLTRWKVIGLWGWWSDIANNFHYVFLTLSHSLINSPTAVKCHCVLDCIPGNLGLGKTLVVLLGNSREANTADTRALGEVFLWRPIYLFAFAESVYPFLSSFL